MKRLKGCISLLAVLFGMTLLFGNFGNGNVQAKVVTDDAGDQVDIPDKYFLESYDSSVNDNNQKMWTYLWPFVNEWVNNPDTKLSDISPMMAQYLPELNTFNDLVERYSEYYPQYNRDNLEYILKGLLTQRNLVSFFPGNKIIDTEGVFVSNRYFNYIAKPSDMTVYNQTGNRNVTSALEYGFKQWNKDTRFHFRMVDNPREAKVIVTDLVHSQSKSKQFESDYDAFFSANIVYKLVLIQGEITLSDKILSMDKNNPKLLHTVVHELGHSIGRPDLF